MLADEDYKWMPYNGNETLIFKSNTNDTDRIFLLHRDTLMAYPEAQSINGVVYETISVFCNHYSRDKNSKGRSYYFFKVQKAKDNRTEMVFSLSLKDAEFFRVSPVKIDSLKNINPISLKTSIEHYDDVFIIYPDDYGMYFYNKNSFVTKLYWSKLKGLVRYERKDGVYWELMKIE